MSTPDKPKASGRPGFKLSRIRIIAIVLLILGAFIFSESTDGGLKLR